MSEEFLHNVTFIQVEALKESLDFLRNGYVDTTCCYSKDLWLMYFRKVKGKRRIKVIVRSFGYVIERDGKVVKSVEGLPDSRRYDVEFDSDVIIKAKRIDGSAGKNLISGSVLPDDNER